MMATKMDAFNTNVTTKKFDEIIQLVKKSDFFSKHKTISINNQQLRQIYLKTIDLPLKLKFYADKQNIFTLEHLLNTETKSILRNRNIGEKTIVKSRRIILENLKKIKDCLVETEPEEYLTAFKDTDCFVGKYFPLLRDNFATTQIYFNLASQDISCIKLPKFIKQYILKKKKIKCLLDLLNVDYNELIKEPMIGHMTIRKLQTEIIDLLNLRKIIFLS